ncbi:DUF5682 family protein [Planctomicrobium sp. SH661]|uniref:DUF5682 family protein n=1 Tax=Planctomicrobium sp. SH661 TaxID=3448124 RepID=UPI003F5C2AC4
MIHVFGIRHHGPGCARSLLGALDELHPDVLVIEAPGDLESALGLAGNVAMSPPVAMLIYPRDEPAKSVIYPLAVFSPEWQALRWAAQHQRPVRAMDLPMSHHMALDAQMQSDAENLNAPPVPVWRADPLAILSEAAGHHDPELWWEEQIERRSDATGVFEAILEAMRAVRDEFPEASEKDLLREAYMRKTIRSVVKEGFQKIAVICGAWHGPFLDQLAIDGKRGGCRVRDDSARLKGLPKVKTVATWIPWTHARLAYRSGYGAGVHAPGWYAHLWESDTEAATRWVVNAARLLRERDLGASSASVIEARRLADALAALRELRTPGLQELNDAILTVLCHGEETPLSLIRKKLEMGDRLGSVPREIPSVPLAEDVEKLQKSLRLKPNVQPRLLDLDLRNDHARRQSQFLYRLGILGIRWGEFQSSGGSLSTFHEVWKLEWQPEFAITLIEANIWGNTLEAAATARLIHRAERSGSLQEMSTDLDAAIHAELSAVFPVLIQKIQSTAAVNTDVLQLMEALPSLAQVVRYGNVRGSDTAQLQPVLAEMVARVCVGLPSACAAVDDDLAARLITGMTKTEQALDLMQVQELTDEFRGRLQQLARGDDHGLIRGWATRSLLEAQLLDGQELEELTSHALSAVNETPQAAAWIQGFLQGSGLLLIHQETVWRVMDRWLAGLQETVFIEMLPVLRRAFSSFSHAERRQMGETVKQFQGESQAKRIPVLEGDNRLIDHPRAAKVLPVLARILGVHHE